MSRKPPPTIFKGRAIGIVTLVVAQLFIGIIHIIFGFWLFSASSSMLFSKNTISASIPYSYTLYTIIFGLLTAFLAIPLWMKKFWGWLGAIVNLAFVVVLDTLTILNVPTIPGIPKSAGFVEIAYSLIIIIYLLQSHVRAQFEMSV